MYIDSTNFLIEKDSVILFLDYYFFFLVKLHCP